MKYFVLFCLLLVACAQPQPAPVREVVPAPEIVVVPAPVAAPAAPKAELGPVQFTIHPYLLGNREAGSVRPGTPLVAKVDLRKKGAGSPPATNNDDVSILVTVVYPTGFTEVYGTPDVEGVIPSNIFIYDINAKAWVNDKFIANADINTQIRYTISVRVGDDTKVFPFTLNVR